ncbi:MAG TPA: hypothetical protein VNS22_22170, partial [Geminicoccus sp.]|nr:hypothetical protein [Geminicoccus sp.]
MPASAAEPSDLNTLLGSMGLSRIAAQVSDRPEDVRGVLQRRFAEVRKSIDRCQTFFGQNFPRAKVDAILKGVALKPGGFDAAVDDAHAHLSDAASTGKLSRRDLETCMRLADMRIGGRIQYVRSLEQIDRSLYKCNKVLAAGTPSKAAVDVLRTLDRRAGSPTYTEAGTLAALDRAFGRPTGLTRLDLDTCAAAYNVDAELLPRSQVGNIIDNCPSGQSVCVGSGLDYACCGSGTVCADSCDEDGDC